MEEEGHTPLPWRTTHEPHLSPEKSPVDSNPNPFTAAPGAQQHAGASAGGGTAGASTAGGTTATTLDLSSERRTDDTGSSEVLCYRGGDEEEAGQGDKSTGGAVEPSCCRSNSSHRLVSFLDSLIEDHEGRGCKRDGRRRNILRNCHVENLEDEGDERQGEGGEGQEGGEKNLIFSPEQTSSGKLSSHRSSIQSDDVTSPGRVASHRSPSQSDDIAGARTPPSRPPGGRHTSSLSPLAEGSGSGRRSLRERVTSLSPLVAERSGSSRSRSPTPNTLSPSGYGENPYARRGKSHEYFTLPPCGTTSDLRCKGFSSSSSSQKGSGLSRTSFGSPGGRRRATACASTVGSQEGSVHVLSRQLSEGYESYLGRRRRGRGCDVELIIRRPNSRNRVSGGVVEGVTKTNTTKAVDKQCLSPSYLRMTSDTSGDWRKEKADKSSVGLSRGGSGTGGGGARRESVVSETSTACGFSTHVHSQASFGSMGLRSFSSQRRLSTMNSTGVPGTAPHSNAPRRFSSVLLRIMGEEGLDEGERSPVGDVGEEDEDIKREEENGGEGQGDLIDSGVRRTRRGSGCSRRETSLADCCLSEDEKVERVRGDTTIGEEVPGHYCHPHPQTEEREKRECPLSEQGGKSQTSAWQPEDIIDRGDVSLTEFLDGSLASRNLNSRKSETTENEFLGESRGLERIEEHDDSFQADRDDSEEEEEEEEPWPLQSHVCISKKTRQLDDFPPWEQQHEEEEGIPVSIPLLPQSSSLTAVQPSIEISPSHDEVVSGLDLISKQTEGSILEAPSKERSTGQEELVTARSSAVREQVHGITEPTADFPCLKESELPRRESSCTHMDVPQGMTNEGTEGSQAVWRRSGSCDARRRSSKYKRGISTPSSEYPFSEKPPASDSPEHQQTVLTVESGRHEQLHLPRKEEVFGICSLPEKGIGRSPEDEGMTSPRAVSFSEQTGFLPYPRLCNTTSAPCQLNRQLSSTGGLSVSPRCRPPGIIVASACGIGGVGEFSSVESGPPSQAQLLSSPHSADDRRESREVDGSLILPETSTVWLCRALECLQQRIEIEASKGMGGGPVQVTPPASCRSDEAVWKGSGYFSPSGRGVSSSVTTGLQSSGSMISALATHQSIIMGLDPCANAAASRDGDVKVLSLYTPPSVMASSLSYSGGLYHRKTTATPTTDVPLVARPLSSYKLSPSAGVTVSQVGTEAERGVLRKSGKGEIIHTREDPCFVSHKRLTVPGGEVTASRDLRDCGHERWMSRTPPVSVDEGREIKNMDLQRQSSSAEEALTPKTDSTFTRGGDTPGVPPVDFFGSFSEKEGAHGIPENGIHDDPNTTKATAVVSFSSSEERLTIREQIRKTLLQSSSSLSPECGAPAERRSSFACADAVRERDRRGFSVISYQQLDNTTEASSASSSCTPVRKIDGDEGEQEGPPGRGCRLPATYSNALLLSPPVTPASSSNNNTFQVYNLVRQLLVHIPLVLDTVAELSISGFSARTTGGRQGSLLQVPCQMAAGGRSRGFVEPLLLCSSTTMSVITPPYYNAGGDMTTGIGYQGEERPSSLSPVPGRGGHRGRSLSSLPPGGRSLLVPPLLRPRCPTASFSPLQLLGPVRLTNGRGSMGNSTPNHQETAWTSQMTSSFWPRSKTPSPVVTPPCASRSMSAGKLEFLSRSKAPPPGGEGRTANRRNTRLDKARAVIHLIPGLYSRHPPALSMLLHDSALPLFFPLLESEVASFASLMIQQPPDVTALLEACCFKRLPSHHSSEDGEGSGSSTSSPLSGRLVMNPCDIQSPGVAYYRSSGESQGRQPVHLHPHRGCRSQYAWPLLLPSSRIEQRSNSFSTFSTIRSHMKHGKDNTAYPSSSSSTSCLRSQFRGLLSRTNSVCGDGSGGVLYPVVIETPGGGGVGGRCLPQGSFSPLGSERLDGRRPSPLPHPHRLHDGNEVSTFLSAPPPRTTWDTSAHSSPSCYGRRHHTTSSSPSGIMSRDGSRRTSLILDGTMPTRENETMEIQTAASSPSSCVESSRGREEDARSLTNLYLLFVGRQVPSLTVGQYVSRLQRLSQLGAHESLVALLLISRVLTRHPYFPLCALNAYRLLLTAFMTVTKAFSDRFYNNGLWARFGGVDVSELNCLEKAFLLLLDHRCFFTLEEFAALFCLVKRVAPALPPQSSSFGVGRSSSMTLSSTTPLVYSRPRELQNSGYQSPAAAGRAPSRNRGERGSGTGGGVTGGRSRSSVIVQPSPSSDNSCLGPSLIHGDSRQRFFAKTISHPKGIVGMDSSHLFKKNLMCRTSVTTRGEGRFSCGSGSCSSSTSIHSSGISGGVSPVCYAKEQSSFSPRMRQSQSSVLHTEASHPPNTTTASFSSSSQCSFLSRHPIVTGGDTNQSEGCPCESGAVDDQFVSAEKMYNGDVHHHAGMINGSNKSPSSSSSHPQVSSTFCSAIDNGNSDNVISIHSTLRQYGDTPPLPVFRILDDESTCSKQEASDHLCETRTASLSSPSRTQFQQDGLSLPYFDSMKTVISSAPSLRGRGTPSSMLRRRKSFSRRTGAGGGGALCRDKETSLSSSWASRGGRRGFLGRRRSTMLSSASSSSGGVPSNGSYIISSCQTSMTSRGASQGLPPSYCYPLSQSCCTSTDMQRGRRGSVGATLSSMSIRRSRGGRGRRGRSRRGRRRASLSSFSGGEKENGTRMFFSLSESSTRCASVQRDRGGGGECHVFTSDSPTEAATMASDPLFYERLLIMRRSLLPFGEGLRERDTPEGVLHRKTSLGEQDQGPQDGEERILFDGHQGKDRDGDDDCDEGEAESAAIVAVGVVIDRDEQPQVVDGEDGWYCIDGGGMSFSECLDHRGKQQRQEGEGIDRQAEEQEERVLKTDEKQELGVNESGPRPTVFVDGDENDVKRESKSETLNVVALSSNTNNGNRRCGQDAIEKIDWDLRENPMSNLLFVVHPGVQRDLLGGESLRL
ncbi:n-terminal domain-containing protein [Cystoisospora suis]|uniref:N-terminal domain-containing protein n=1 Tax=Cystoisospora suis TaxID=483139 RepID=A0A2C6KYA6_9APIC|nr:n-terminal domain-containing protein [Cystoisospora suis]